ncbi:hypothetical protein F9278_21375 [Streptomyces phaeolivaceus]|uniref:Integral membrane protein n=1 Tax=Streptomyces phaeolivaceus TaxID=2653200 RepID=A0A5P8K5N5_9ACTN|nr:hypothetical protein [Streptomyces phaeolivaceus]QFQ98316.1 hypothetical protein F9278_21375 [Streptomyces phaeolivaceus]
MRKMLRKMESGEPVELVFGMSTMTGLTRLAFIAEQFGYEYVDLNISVDNKMALRLVPALNPEARERAARNRARYPDARDGGELPPVVGDELELLKARMVFDLGHQYTDKQRAVIAGFGFAGLVAGIGLAFVDSATGVGVAVGSWVALMGLVYAGLAATRRRNVRYTAQLQAAGFTPVTDRGGRLRYLPPGRQLPGHGNPFA